MVVVVNPGLDRSVVSIYQKWSKEGAVVNQRQGHGRPRVIDAHGERRLARVIRANRRATVAQIAEEVNAGSDRKVSEYTVHDGAIVLKTVKPHTTLDPSTSRDTFRIGKSCDIFRDRV
ncbi:hypothetical protein QTP70_005484 [Hemibagrus guttatus]|uniref:Uncharacterized protein n=1 Tax=Hemibagrus guttatus TaxID=175788 RepID=A0AAE0QYZ6_9TELE|nr:hypothetical protein QTP70_005484 [Hemibagrus guttatus]